MTAEEMAKEYANEVYGNRTEIDYYGIADAFQDGAKFGFQKGKKELEKENAELKAKIEKLKKNIMKALNLCSIPTNGGKR